MFCVECLTPVQCLYLLYHHAHVRTTVCHGCGSVADRYIEYDHVVLFIDMLLLKPQAFRHVALNQLEQEWGRQWAGVLRLTTRICILMGLFDVYLTWAYEERSGRQAGLAPLVLLTSITQQYAYYIVRASVEFLVFYAVLVPCFRQLYVSRTVDFAKVPRATINPTLPTTVHYSRSFFLCAFVLATSMAAMSKLFPILMLIWPYDTPALAPVIAFVGNVHVVVAIAAITGSTHTRAVASLALALVVQAVVAKGVMCVVVGYWMGLDSWQLATGEVAAMWDGLLWHGKA